MQLNARNRLDLLEVDAQDAPLCLARLLAKRIDARHRHLTPATRRAAQIDHPRAWHEKAEFVVKLHDLERRAPAIAFKLRALDIGVIQLPLQPARRRRPSAPCRLDLDCQVALPAPRSVLAVRPLRHQSSPSINTPSAAICA